MKNLITVALLTLILLRISLEGFGYGNFIIPFLYLLFPMLFMDLKNFVISKLYIVFLLFALLIFSYSFINSLSFTSNYFSLLSGVLRYGSLFIVALLFKRTEISFRIFFNFYLLLAILEFVVYSFQFSMGMERPSGTMYSRNHIGVFLLPGIFVSLIYLKNYLMAFLFVVFLIFLGGIGNILAAFIGLLYYMLTMRKKVIIGLSIFSLFGIIMVSIFYQRISDMVDNFQNISERLDSGVVGGGDSFTWRLISWHNLFSESLEKNKYIFGFGLESTSSPSVNIFGFQPHNDYVKVFIEGGIVGLIILLPIFWLSIRKFSAFNFYDISIRVTLVATMISMLSNNVLLHVSYLWIIIGFGSIKRL